jgi:hypothetical protein
VSHISNSNIGSKIQCIQIILTEQSTVIINESNGKTEETDSQNNWPDQVQGKSA